MATTLSVVNRKGGVGKTSFTLHVGGCLAEQGHRVLLIDNDPQHSLSSGLLGLKQAATIPADETIAALFDETCHIDPEQLIRDTPVERLDLLPCSDSLSHYNIPNADEAGPLQLVLRDFVSEIGERYDLILIDNLQLCSIASLAAADVAVCPTQSEDFGSQGASTVRALIEDLRVRLNPDLRFLGFVLNMFDRRLTVHRVFETTLQKTYGEAVFASRALQRSNYSPHTDHDLQTKVGRRRGNATVDR